MSISQDTANLIDTLAHASSQIGSTVASEKIQGIIIDLLPATAAEDLEALRTATRIQAENLELLRGKLAEISSIAKEALPFVEKAGDDFDPDDLRKIIALAEPNDDAPAA